MMRLLHRWTSLPLILFLLLVLATGVYLQFEEIGKLGGRERPSEAAGQATMPSDAALQAQLSEALAKAREAEPDFVPRRIELTLGDGEGKGRTRLSHRSRSGPFVEVDHSNGETVADMAPKVSMHVWMIRLHTGSAMGAFGVIVMLVSSLILLFLAISGGYLYWKMWRQRTNAGRKGLFWK